ncbi:MAG TPA: hypothetical protein VGM43_10730 [Bryobacteraceae bacterium]|jgi:hypothetical protein
MEIYKSETREILRRYSGNRISRAECLDSLDCALLAALPDLNAPDLLGVQVILTENARILAELDGQKQCPDPVPPISQPAPQQFLDAR